LGWSGLGWREAQAAKAVGRSLAGAKLSTYGQVGVLSSGLVVNVQTDVVRETSRGTSGRAVEVVAVVGPAIESR
jgi:hypothetical protein